MVEGSQLQTCKRRCTETNTDARRRTRTHADEHMTNCVWCVGGHNLKTRPDVRRLLKDFWEALQMWKNPLMVGVSFYVNSVLINCYSYSVPRLTPPDCTWQEMVEAKSQLNIVSLTAMEKNERCLTFLKNGECLLLPMLWNHLPFGIITPQLERERIP